MGRQQGGRGQRPGGRDMRGGRVMCQRGDDEKALGGGKGPRDRGGVFGTDDARKRDAEKGGGVRSAAKRSVIRPTGDFIEGRRAVTEALRAGFPVKRALVAEGEGKDAALGQLVDYLHAAGVPVIVLEVGAFPYAELADIVARAGEGPALVVVLDHVTDAGNFGAIVRSAEVVGAAGVVIANKRAAEVTVATYKTSAGAVMHLPIARVPNIARALEDLKQAGFWCVGASEHAEGSCWESPLTGRIALVMGSEGEGISRLVLETCDDLTRLPQRGVTESLNVAQATTALAYEWLRVNIAELGDAGAAVSDQGREIAAAGAGE